MLLTLCHLAHGDHAGKSLLIVPGWCLCIDKYMVEITNIRQFKCCPGAFWANNGCVDKWRRCVGDFVAQDVSILVDLRNTLRKELKLVIKIVCTIWHSSLITELINRQLCWEKPKAILFGYVGICDVNNIKVFAAYLQTYTTCCCLPFELPLQTIWEHCLQLECVVYVLNIMTGSNIIFLTGWHKVSQHNWLDCNLNFTKNTLHKF